MNRRDSVQPSTGRHPCNWQHAGGVSPHNNRASATSLLWLLVVVVVASSCLQLCSAQTAYLIPSLEQDVPSNSSYARLGNIMFNPAVLHQYDVIVLTADYRLQPQLYSQNEPIALTRNLTIVSANFSTHGYRLLELEFLTQRLLIPQGLSLTLKDLALGRARKTSGQGLPFFVGQGERSLLVLDNVIRIRTACAHNEPELVAALQSIVWRSTPSGIRQQEVELLPKYIFRGKEYDDNIHATELHYFVGPVDVPDTNYYSGYSMVQINSTRICETYVSDECVIKRGADVCVMEQIDVLARIDSPAAQPSSAQGDRNLAPIVAPAVVVGSLLLAGLAAGLLIMRRRRRARTKRSRQSLLPVDTKHGFGSGGSDGLEPLQGPPGPRPLASPVNPTPLTLPGAYSGAVGTIEALAIGSKAGSWRLAAFHTAPEFEDATPDDKLKLGLLLGAGSFGRVYAGVWRQFEVAVKVLQHDSSTAAAIANEVDLVMSFRHPNIVAGYYFVTWTRDHGAEEVDTLQRQWTASSITGEGASCKGSGSTADQLHSTAAGTLSSPRSPQPLLAGAAAPRTHVQLEPVIEASSGTTTRQSSGQKSAVASNACSNSNCSTVSESGPVRPGTADVKQQTDSQQQPDHMGCCSSASSSSSGNASHTAGSSGVNMVAVFTRSDNNISVDNNSCGGGAAAAAKQGPSHIAPQQQTSSSRTRSSSDNSWASSSQQLPAALPMLSNCPSVSSNSSSFRGAGGGSAGAAPPTANSSQQLHLPTLQLLPFTTLVSQHPQQQHMSADEASHQAYEVSNTVTASSSAAGTSSSFIAAAYGSGQQRQQPWLQQLSLDAKSDADQQPLSKADCEMRQQRQQELWHNRAFAVLQDPCEPSEQQQQQHLQPPGGVQSAASPFGPVNDGGKAGAGAARGRGTEEAQTWLIFEFCDGGTLLDLFAEGGPLGPHLQGRRRLAQVLTLLLDIAAGMSYLHSRNVLHGDLKPCNVLIKHVQGAPYCRMALVSDFGLSRALQAGQSHRSTKTFGTLNHTPPELLRLGRLSPAGDVYAFGVMMWEAYTGQVAFSGLHYGEVFEQVALLQKRPDIPDDMPPEYAELVKQCWAADPYARPPFTTVKERLETMLSALMQDEAEAQERFIADL